MYSVVMFEYGRLPATFGAVGRTGPRPVPRPWPPGGGPLQAPWGLQQRPGSTKAPEYIHGPLSTFTGVVAAGDRWGWRM